MAQERRFFVNQSIACGAVVELSAADSHHIRDVLRLSDGAALILVSRVDNQTFNATLASQLSAQGCSTVVIGEQLLESKNLPTHKSHLLVALPKSDLPEWITEKATELGVDSIYFFEGDRSVAKLKGTAEVNKKQRRLELVAEAASKQSKRSAIPRVVVTETLETALHSLPETIKLFTCSMNPNAPTLGRLTPPPGDYALVVGPEGDLSPAETALLARSGSQDISLGQLTLRVETAAICALAQTSLLWQT